MKNKIIGSTESMRKVVTDMDDFGEKIDLNFKGDTNVKTTCGGMCSILRNLILIFLCLWSFSLLVNFSNYNISQSLIFYDVKELEIGVNKTIKDFTFGFKHNG